MDQVLLTPYMFEGANALQIAQRAGCIDDLTNPEDVIRKCVTDLEGEEGSGLRLTGIKRDNLKSRGKTKLYFELREHENAMATIRRVVERLGRPVPEKLINELRRRHVVYPIKNIAVGFHPELSMEVYHDYLQESEGEWPIPEIAQQVKVHTGIAALSRDVGRILLKAAQHGFSCKHYSLDLVPHADELTLALDPLEPKPMDEFAALAETLNDRKLPYYGAPDTQRSPLLIGVKIGINPDVGACLKAVYLETICDQFRHRA
ncbi:hypothetical protein ACQU0X_26545 [Pseudovibrio ascidiaceicola]|uniref:hypothetical protein n=1 Tax=Pseudovibrio ascidiaceicola TaxID=285279 RepID=UPI003D35E324